MKKAVITVPLYFSDAQRRATEDAARIAGLEVLQIMNEPTAAALAYGHQDKSDKAKKIMVFHLGGGTFDVCIISVDNDGSKVVSASGDTHLGGEDFDNILVDYFKSKIM